jgi:hypothetical protein
MIVAFAIVIAPLIPDFALGENALIGVHDVFDASMVWYKVLAESGMMFAPPTETVPVIMDGLPRTCYGSEFYFLVWLVLWFGPLGAYLANLAFMRMVGFFGMYLLLKKHFLKEDEYEILTLGVAICFAVLPFWPPGGLSIPSLPLALFAFLNIRSGTSTKADWLILVLIPFYASVVFSYSFFLLFIGILWMYDFFKSHKINSRFIGSMLLMSAFFLIVEYRLVLDLLLGSSYVSHRTEFRITDLTIQEALYKGLANFINGQYHAPSLHFPIILVTVGIAFGVVVFRRLTKSAVAEDEGRAKIVLVIVIACAAISLWYGLWYSVFWESLKLQFTLLRIYQFSRVDQLHPLLWYLAFAIGLRTINGNLRIRSKPIGALVVVALLVMQVAFVYPSTWVVVSSDKSGHDPITYRHYFAADQFSQIREDIGLPQESYRVINVGLHPTIAQFNGFYTLDGYFSNYPLEYKHRFRNIIGYELEKSEELRDYFDGWGSRCYILAEELSTGVLYTKDKNMTIYSLQLNVTALHEMNCTFVFSSVNIANHVDSGLQLVDVYEQADSAWRIFLYEVL